MNEMFCPWPQFTYSLITVYNFFRQTSLGRDFYRVAVLSLLLSSLGAQSRLPALAIVPLLCFAPKGARSLRVCSYYKHLAPLERKQIHCCTCKSNSPFDL